MKLQPAHPKHRRSKAPLVLIILLVLLVGGVFYLSTVPKEQPLETMEAEIRADAE